MDIFVVKFLLLLYLSLKPDFVIILFLITGIKTDLSCRKFHQLLACLQSYLELAVWQYNITK